MTQHQAPEVTSELRECPLCNREPKRNGRMGVGGVICQSSGHLVQVYGASQADADKNWNTRATQPLSLTVEAKDGLPSAAFDVLDWLRDNREAIIDRLQSLSLPVAGEQIAESANCSGGSRFHFTDDSPFPVETIEGTILLGKGWLAITEDEYRQLNALAVDIDRSGLAQEVE